MGRFNQEDVQWMSQAIRLAKRGVGMTSPNPCVGSVIIKNKKIIGSGFHARAGSDHAEVIAMKMAGKRVEGSTLYSTMEPCAHYGTTPPCVCKIIQSGIKKVVFGQVDPNPLNKGKGAKTLLKHKIRVYPGVLEKECSDLNRPFKKWILKKLPYVTIKIAQSIDGKIATRTRDSKWMSSEKARAYVQNMRKGADGVLVGINTVLMDNPRLDVRIKADHSPVKVILDSQLRISSRAKLFTTPGKVIIATTSRSSAQKRKRLGKYADLILAPEKKGSVDLAYVLRELGKRKILHLLVEGGGEVIARFITERLADEAYFFVTPKIVGGRDAPTSVEGEGVEFLKDAKCLKEFAIERIGSDYLIHGRF